MDRRKREKTLLTIIVAAAAAFMAIVFGFFLKELKSHNSLIAEYDASKESTLLTERYAAGETITAGDLDSRVKSFGIYLLSGESVIVLGKAPAFIDPGNAKSRQILRDGKTSVLRLIRPIGGMRMPPGQFQGPGQLPGQQLSQVPGQGPGMEGRIPGRGRLGAMGMAQRFVLMDYDITAFARDNLRLSILFSILGIGFLFLLALLLLFYRRIEMYRKSEEEHKTLLQLGEAARTLAHEIKNPLGTLRVQTAILGRSLESGHDQSLAIMREEIARISALTDRVGEFLKNPAGTPQLIDLSVFLADLTKRFHFPVSLSVKEGEKRVVRFDPERLRSVAENIIVNAHESMEGSGTVELVIDGTKKNTLLHVMDRGKGIPQEQRKRVFDPFFTTKIKGQGVGLAVSRQFVEAAGGRIDFADRPGGGTVFTIELASGGES